MGHASGDARNAATWQSGGFALWGEVSLHSAARLQPSIEIPRRAGTELRCLRGWASVSNLGSFVPSPLRGEGSGAGSAATWQS